MTYPTLATVNATTDLSNLFVYANTVTGGYFIPMVMAAMFLIVMFGTYFAAVRFRGFGRFDVSFLVASFVTFGMATIASSKDGLLNVSYVFISIAFVLLGFMWVSLSGRE